MTTTKKLIASVASVLALLASANAANAMTENQVFDSCMAHDWARFAEAVENNDFAALDQMARDPELRGCPEMVSTARLLACQADPLACIEPAAGPDPKVDIPPPPSVEIECPTWNLRCTDALPPPGAHIGVENDRTDNSDNDDGNEAGGNGGGASSAPSGPAARS